MFTKGESELIQYLGYISSRISSIDTTNALVKEISRITEELVEVQYTAIYLWNPILNKLQLLEAKGFTEEDKKHAEDSVMDRHPGWVFKNKQIFHIPDTDLDSGSISKTGKRSFKVRSRLFVPVLTSDKCMGTIGFASSTANVFSERHINVIKFIANLSGAVYSNILLKAAENEYQAQLEKALKESENAKRQQQSFFAKMSHELRTPMNAIIGMSELIKKTDLDEIQNKYANAISASSKSLLSIINDILDISKINSDKFQLEFISFNLYELIQEIHDGLENLAHEKGIELNVKKAKDIPEIEGDPLRLKQVIINLLNNAIKFTKEGHVTLEVNTITESKENISLQFKIIDTGKGIEKKNLSNIFKSFEQENKGISRNFGGTGLGLTISKEIINLFGSEINVKSKINVGSEFYYTLKFKKSTKTVKNIIKETKEYNLEYKKILIVEDNEINQIYAEAVLNSYKCITRIANNGKEAVDIFDTETFDLILMDMQMPIMDGIEATKIIRLKSKIPIIGLSANTVQSDVDLCLNSGMNSYLSKPFKPVELNQSIGKLLKLPNQENKAKKNTPEKHNRNGSIYDLSKIIEHSNNNTEFIKKMLKLFIDETPKEIEALKNYLNENKYEDLSEIAHKIKPNFNYLGINKGYELCLKLEKNSGKQQIISEDINELNEITLSAINEFNKIINSL